MPDATSPFESRILGLVREITDRGAWDLIRNREPEELLEAELLTPDNFVRFAADYDPHEGRKPYLGWLVRTYAAGGFALEDFSKAKGILESFRKWKAKLPPEMRDINVHRTLAEVSALVMPFEAAEREAGLTTSKRQADRLETDVAMAESLVLLEREDGFTIAVPMTERSAKWWSRSTKWCTGGESRNYFDIYHRSAPLLVLRWADGRKLQAWFPIGRAAEIRDETDGRVKPSFVTERWKDIEGLIRAFIVTNPMCFLQYMQFDRGYRQFALNAVRQNGNFLMSVPRERRDRETCTVAVRQAPNMLTCVPDWLKDHDMCLSAVSANGSLLHTVPEELRGRHVCEVALKTCGRMLQCVPLHLRDRKMCMIALANEGGALTDVPWRLRNRETCLVALRGDPRALHHVPRGVLRRADYLEVMSGWGQGLEYVPPRHRTREMCLAAITQDPSAIVHVPTYLCDLGMGATLQAMFEIRSVVPAEYAPPVEAVIQEIPVEPVYSAPPRNPIPLYLLPTGPFSLTWQASLALCREAMGLPPVGETALVQAFLSRESSKT